MGRFPGRAGEEGHCRRNLDLTSRFYHVFSLVLIKQNTENNLPAGQMKFPRTFQPILALI